MIREQDLGERRSSESLWLTACDVFILGLFTLAPLFLGGRHPVGRLAFACFVLGAATCWLVSCFHPSDRLRKQTMLGGGWFAVAATLLVITQLLTIPPSLLKLLSPGISDYLVMWHQGQQLSWTTLTIAPHATRHGLAMTLSYSLLLFVLLQRLNSYAQAVKFLKWLGIAIFLMALLALAQYLSGNGKFLWIYDHPSRDTFNFVRGPFQNQNHFGHMMALGASIFLWWISETLRCDTNRKSEINRPRHAGSGKRDAKDRSMWKNPDNRFRWILPAIGLMTLCLAGVLTYSRGTLIALSISCLCTTLCLLLSRLLPVVPTLLSLGGITLVLVLGATTRTDLWQKRIVNSLDAESMVQLSPSRFELWSADVQAHQQFPWIGTGVGSHRYVYRTFLDREYDQEFAYAESSFIHLLLETGRLGILILIAAVSWTCYRIYQHARHGEQRFLGMILACASGLAASTLQAVADFVWQIPACLAAVIVLLAVLWKHPATYSRKVITSAKERSSTGGYFILTYTGCLLPLVISIVLPAARASVDWDHYLRVSLNSIPASSQASPTKNPTHEKITFLRNALSQEPEDPRIHERLMLLYFDLLQEKIGPLHLIRMSANEPLGLEDRIQRSRETFGKHFKLLEMAYWHSTQTLRMAPFCGKAYIVHAELRPYFSDSSPQHYHQEIAQAVLVRPFDPMVLYYNGLAHQAAGDFDEAIRNWVEAANHDPAPVFQLAPMLAIITSGDRILQISEPNGNTCLRLAEAYTALGKDREVRLFMNRYAKIVSEIIADLHLAEQKGAYLNQLSMMQEKYNDPDGALLAMKAAVTITPSNYAFRERLAYLALARRQYQLASENLQWCLRRSSDDLALKQADLECRKQLRAVEISKRLREASEAPVETHF